jgi:hypothetical protein
VNEQSIIWHTGLGVVIDVNIEVGTVCTRTSWSLADRLASISDLWTKCKVVGSMPWIFIAIVYVSLKGVGEIHWR